MDEIKNINNLFFRVDISIASRTDLNIYDKFIYSFVSTFWRNDATFTASNAYIAKCLGISRRQVIYSIKKLTDLGMFEKDLFALSGHNTQRTLFKPKKELTINSSNLLDLYNKVVKKEK